MHQRKHSRTISDLLSHIQSVREISSNEIQFESETNIISEFLLLLEKLSPILNDLKYYNIKDSIPIREVIESIETNLKQSFTLIQNPNSVKQMEEQIHDLGSFLGLLLLFVSDDVSTEIRQEIGELHKEMMNFRVEIDLGMEEGESEKKEKIEKVLFDVNDVFLQIKYGNEVELKFALLGLSTMIKNKIIDKEWIIIDQEIIPILIRRLGRAKQDNRLSILIILRTLASETNENLKIKEKMVDVGSLSIFVKSLVRNAEESREAMGLLLVVSDIVEVRQRIGRIKGCIIMLVTLLNGDDPIASSDASILLNALSSNTQDVLHMAEAGYFRPLVRHLVEGSDMSKVLMATALSRMVLTDQSRATLGEEGSIKPLVEMLNSGKLEAKISALGALRNLSSLKENIERLVNSGIVATLLKLLFSVTSVLMTLREPASAILASIAQSKSILGNHDIANQMLSLLNLSQPTVQYHLLRALNSIISHSRSSRVRAKMKKNGGIQLLLPFLSEDNIEIRMSSLNLLYNLTKDLSGDLTEQLGETYIKIIVNIISTSTVESEKAACFGILCNVPVSDKKATDMLKKANILPILISILCVSTKSSTPVENLLLENVAGVLLRFTISSDKKLQLFSAEQGIIPLLVKSLSVGSIIVQSRAATSLAQLSQNSFSLSKSRTSKWSCISPSSEFCKVHDGYCFIKTSFCLIKSGAVPPLIRILEGKERDADEAVLGALATLMQDEIWVEGSNVIVEASGIEAFISVLELGTLKAQEKVVWFLERIFRVEAHRVKYGGLAQPILIELTQKGSSSLKPTIAKILAHLDLLQVQSSYF